MGLFPLGFIRFAVPPNSRARRFQKKKEDSSFPFFLSRVSYPSRNSFGSRIYLVPRDTERLNPHPANLVGSQGSLRVSCLPVWFLPLDSAVFSFAVFAAVPVVQLPSILYARFNPTLSSPHTKSLQALSRFQNEREKKTPIQENPQ